MMDQDIFTNHNRVMRVTNAILNQTEFRDLPERKHIRIKQWPDHYL
jgi:hypothetical protein